jgi:hypothetical protein
MNVQNLVLLCLIFTIVKCQSSDDDPVGTECTTRQTHYPGTCQHRDDCPAVKSGEIPFKNVTYCNRRQNLVCCPNRDKDSEINVIRIEGERISDRSKFFFDYLICIEKLQFSPSQNAENTQKQHKRKSLWDHFSSIIKDEL